jgi:hypothetical protein
MIGNADTQFDDFTKSTKAIVEKTAINEFSLTRKKIETDHWQAEKLEGRVIILQHGVMSIVG